MHDKNNIIDEQIFMKTLRTIATAYQQISVMKMKETREYIQHSRSFVTKLKEIFESLKFSSPYLDLKKLRKNSMATKAEASVFISANAKFHGDILRRIFSLFLKHMNPQSDIYVIGRVGKEFIKAYPQEMHVTFVDIPDEDIRIKTHLLPLIQKLMQYKKIQIYYAQFKTVIDQEPESLEIETIETLLQEGTEKKRTNEQKDQMPIFLFEPSGEEIAQFLNDNVLVSLMRQSLYDTQLARYGSRITAMNSLLNNIDDNLHELKRKKRKIIHDIENKKQLERISGMLVMG